MELVSTALAQKIMKIDEDQWCSERRNQVEVYLQTQNIKHGRISEYPAWDVIPYTSIWAIESKKSPEWVGWWVICGDHPTDYISAKDIKDPQKAYKQVASNWLEICDLAKLGKQHPSIKIRLNSHEEIGMLKSRAQTFLEWVADDNNWVYE
jgi:Domain of unknown function (DUF4826)